MIDSAYQDVRNFPGHKRSSVQQPHYFQVGIIKLWKWLEWQSVSNIYHNTTTHSTIIAVFPEGMVAWDPD